MNTLLTSERTNTRDGIIYDLTLTDDGTPMCPHCGTPMALVGDKFENAFCNCWWRGASDINFYGQVVVESTDEGEAALRARQAASALELKKKQEANRKMEDTRRASFVGKKAITKLHFVPDVFGKEKPRYLKDEVEVKIERCYIKEYESFQGGRAEVFDVVYPDGRRRFIRASQVERVLD